jgi:S1-C subfamily serine protease
VRIPVKRESLPKAAGLVVAAVAGGAVAIAGAALLDVGENTTTVREVVLDRPTFSGNVSQATSGRMTLRDIYRQDAPGVVQVTSTTKVKLPRSQWFGNPFGLQGTDVQQSLGSGFVIDKAGLVVTNYHVVGSARTVYVSFSNSDSMSAEIVGRDASTDVALLKVIASSRALTPLPLGNSDNVEVGDEVAAIGNPLGYERSITLGIVSALHRSLTSPGGAPIDRVIQTDAVLNRGNSGGPLLNARGKVIGVSSAIATGAGTGNTGIGFAIPINTVRDVVAQLKTSGHVEHPFFGVVSRPISSRIARVFNLAAPTGLLVESVYSGSGAEQAGLVGGSDQVVLAGESYQLGGDLIVKVDGMPVSTTERLREIVAQHEPGDTVLVHFYRGSELRTTNVKLGRQSPPPLE